MANGYYGPEGQLSRREVTAKFMDDLLGCLSEKAALLGTILDETQKQGDLLARGDLDGLGVTIEARQACMDAIDALDKRIGQAGNPGNAATRKLGDTIGALLRQIMEIDAVNNLLANKLAATFMSGIRETNAEKSLLAYQSQGNIGSKFVNREG
jgi:hypothetical protein